MNSFQTRLKELREKNGLSQKALAESFGFNQSSVGNWEAGNRIADDETKIKLAQFFNVSVGYLLGVEEYNPGYIEYQKDYRLVPTWEDSSYYDDYEKASDDEKRYLLKKWGVPNSPEMKREWERLAPPKFNIISINSEEFTQRDVRLLNLFHQLNEIGQDKMLELADDLVQSKKYKENNKTDASAMAG